MDNRLQSAIWGDLPRHHYAVILADPPWRFEAWSDKGKNRSAENHYPTMTQTEIKRLPVRELAATDCALFLWTTWTMLPSALQIVRAWGFKYKTCAFDWIKADPMRLWHDEKSPALGMGYWTRQNSEFVMLATRGRPRRVNKDVRQIIIAPRTDHSRKPPETYDRIERLVAGPYVELFARSRRTGWDSWGNESDRFPDRTAGHDNPVTMDI